MSEELDSTGAPFDPALHYAKGGRGVLTKAGLWRRRPFLAPAGTDAASLKSQNLELRQRLERLEAAFAERPKPQPSASDLAVLAAAIEELGRLRPGAAASPTRPEGTPNFLPYKGLVRAKVKCATDCLHEEGDVFTVDLRCLWSDDPFEPVTLENGVPVANPAAPAPVDYRFRLRVDEATQALPARAI